MAYATNPININRGTTGLTLTPEQAQEVWAGVLHESAVMQLAQRVELPGSGISIPVITGDPVADFVAETAEKPVSNATFSTRTMTPYKIAVIELFSREFMRDFGMVYDELVRRLPYSIARKFDATVAGTTAPGTGFDVLGGATAVSMAPASGGTVYDQLVAAFTAVGAGGYTLNGWAMAPQARAALLAAVDGNKRPLFIDSPNDQGAVGRVLGAPVVDAPHIYSSAGTVNTVGLAGDWSRAKYGIVNDIEVSISEEATVNDGTNQVNLWQRNMFAVRVEAEVGFVVSDAAAFVKLTTPKG